MAFPSIVSLANGFKFNPNKGVTVLPQGTTSNQVLAAMQAAYGVQQYDRQKSSRWPYYSGVNYPAAGANVINFFGVNQSQAAFGAWQTNLEEPNSLGNYSFFVEGIGFDYGVLSPATTAQPQAYTTDATAIYADLVHGFAQAGYWQFKVGTNTWDMCPRPFLYSPPALGSIRMETAGAFAFTQAGGAPYVVTAAQTQGAYADLERRAWRRRILKNPLFLAPQQTFTAQIRYDSGAVPVLSTDVITEVNKLFVFCRLDGTRFAPIG